MNVSLHSLPVGGTTIGLLTTLFFIKISSFTFSQLTDPCGFIKEIVGISLI